jgi:HTH-type transcriptional regulator, competence development regulator
MRDFNNDPEWMRRKAEEEDGSFVSVAGSLYKADEEKRKIVDATRVSFSRFVHLARKEKRLTLEQFAERTDVDLFELVNIETEKAKPKARTVYQIADFLGLPEQRLMALAGLLEVKDVQFQEESVRFAARAETLEAPTPEEHAAFEAWVKFLSKD